MGRQLEAEKQRDCEDVDVEELLCEDFLSRWGCEGRAGRLRVAQAGSILMPEAEAEVELRLLFYQQVLMRPEALISGRISVLCEDFAEDPKFFHLVARGHLINSIWVSCCHRLGLPL